jgi:AraC family transcriptional regulator
MSPISDIRRRSADYAKTMARSFEFDERPALVTRKLGTSISLLDGTARCKDFSDPMPIEDAFVLLVRLKESPPYQLWIDGRYTPTGSLKAGTSSIFDLRTSPYCISVGHFRHVHFYLPRQALNTICAAEGVGGISEISYAEGFSHADSVVQNLALALESAFEAPERTNRIFIDHITIGVADHFLKTYGGVRLVQQERQSCLSSRQMRWAKELLSARVDGEVTLSELAAGCNMSIRQFRQSFKASIGVLPHRWLLRYRIDQALTSLRRGRLSLFDVALLSGFANVQHLTDVFLRQLGNPPEAFQTGPATNSYLRH